MKGRNPPPGTHSRGNERIRSSPLRRTHGAARPSQPLYRQKREKTTINFFQCGICPPKDRQTCRRHAVRHPIKAHRIGRVSRPCHYATSAAGISAGGLVLRMLYAQYFTGLAMRYFLTINATLKTMASSNSRRSSPVSLLIFSRRYTSVLRCTNSLRDVSETFRLFSKKR